MLLSIAHSKWIIFPLYLALVMPFMSLLIGQFIRKGKCSLRIWWGPIIIQSLTVIFAYLSLKSGNLLVTNLREKLSLELIDLHVSQAEMFVALSVTGLALSFVIYFIQNKYRYAIVLLFTLILIIQSWQAHRVRHSGLILKNYHIQAQQINIYNAYPSGRVPDQINDNEYED